MFAKSESESGLLSKSCIQEETTRNLRIPSRDIPAVCLSDRGGGTGGTGGNFGEANARPDGLAVSYEAHVSLKKRSQTLQTLVFLGTDI